LGDADPDGWLMLIGAGARAGREAIVYSYRSEDGETMGARGPLRHGGVEMPGQYWELPMLLEIGDRWMLMGTPVVEGVPARTLYWLGDFDGTAVHPRRSRAAPVDILATYRAPTIARGPRGTLSPSGSSPTRSANEQERHEAGWVHVLTPATMLRLCEDEPQDLCHSLAPHLRLPEREAAGVPRLCGR
jgi:beta-fructofuranosidase